MKKTDSKIFIKENMTKRFLKFKGLNETLEYINADRIEMLLPSEDNYTLAWVFNGQKTIIPLPLELITQCLFDGEIYCLNKYFFDGCHSVIATSSMSDYEIIDLDAEANFRKDKIRVEVKDGCWGWVEKDKVDSKQVYEGRKETKFTLDLETQKRLSKAREDCERRADEAPFRLGIMGNCPKISTRDFFPAKRRVLKGENYDES